jgi:lipopolysaccharide export LptBFGC system permease protein LptF
MSVATILGERQIIPAMWAAWLPNLVMFGAAGWLYRQAR